MAKCGWLLISVLLISVVYAERECSKGLLTPGYTNPHGDILIEYGDPLDIICVLNDNYTKEHGEYSSKNLYFVRDEKIIPSGMIEILNSSSIRLHIEKPPKSSSVHTCKLRNGTQAAVCFNNVIVGRPRYGIEDCGGDGKYNSFYVSVRAINFVNGKRYEGPWSDELESLCLATQNAWVWLLIPLSLIFVVGFFYLGKKMYFRYREVCNVEVTLPPGLTRMDPTDMDLTHWGSSKIQDDASRPPSADEELLLVKRSDSQNLSGDSSGCSSGHESVTSFSESGTLSNSSESGTEQPRSASTEDLHKNSLRLRNVSSNRPVVSKGYVTMPTDNSAWNAKTAPGNYCSLDSVPVTSSSYVPAAIPQMEPQKMPPYVLSDASNQSTPYVLTGDLTKLCNFTNFGYVPLNPNDPVEKNSAYVMAGNKIPVIPDVVRIEPYKSPEIEEKSYVQVADAIRKPVPDCNPAPADVAQAKTGYVAIGEISKAGYIPHRHFDAKTLKED